MKNATHTTDFLVKVREILERKPANLHAEIIDLSKHYAGDENRFIRQEITFDLIGIKHPINKCGIGSLAAYTMTYLKGLEQAVIAKHDQEGIAGIDYEMEGEVTVAPAVSKKETAAERGAKAIAKAEKSAEIAALVGLKVIRKACQRKGEVTAIEGQHVTVTLEDGSKRKPCMSRFEKLYIQA